MTGNLLSEHNKSKVMYLLKWGKFEKLMEPKSFNSLDIIMRLEKLMAIGKYQRPRLSFDHHRHFSETIEAIEV